MSQCSESDNTVVTQKKSTTQKKHDSRVNVVKVVNDFHPTGVCVGTQLPAQLESSVNHVLFICQPDVERHLLGLFATYVAVGSDEVIAKPVAVTGAQPSMVCFQQLVNASRVA